jgi:hypothetical protein
MGKKKAAKAGTAPRKAPKAAKPRRENGGGPAAESDAELLARLVELQERTAAVGRQLRAIGDLVSTVTREATVTAAEVIERLGGAADAESPEPPPVAARPRRPRSGGS